MAKRVCLNHLKKLSSGKLEDGRIISAKVKSIAHVADDVSDVNTEVAEDKTEVASSSVLTSATSVLISATSVLTAATSVLTAATSVLTDGDWKTGWLSGASVDVVCLASPNCSELNISDQSLSDGDPRKYFGDYSVFFKGTKVVSGVWEPGIFETVRVGMGGALFRWLSNFHHWSWSCHGLPEWRKGSVWPISRSFSDGKLEDWRIISAKVPLFVSIADMSRPKLRKSRPKLRIPKQADILSL